MTAFPILGFELSGEAAAAWTVGYIVVSLVLIIWIPRRSFPIEPSHGLDDQAKLMEMRSRVRQSIIQVVGGIVAVVGLIVTLQQLRRDDEKFNRDRSALFAKSVGSIMKADAKPEERAEAMYVLSYIARSDKSYHRSVFDAVSSYIRGQSDMACKDASYRADGYQPDRVVQIAMTVIGERHVDDDTTGKQLNIERGCFAGLDLRDQKGIVKGLTNARMSQAKMLRVDLTKVEMPDAELMGIEAGDFLNPNWSESIGYTLHQGSKGDDRKGINDGDVRRKFVAHFIEADLTNVNFSGAGLQGADFSGAKLSGAQFHGAKISRANFNGAKGLKLDQFMDACVGQDAFTPEQLIREQPYFDPAFRAELAKDPTLKNGIARCR